MSARGKKRSFMTPQEFISIQTHLGHTNESFARALDLAKSQVARMRAGTAPIAFSLACLLRIWKLKPELIAKPENLVVE
jgi:predicted transcriptional regulator